MAYSSYSADIDFIKLWKSIAQFFAYYVILARKWAKFYTDTEFLLEYLRQRDLYICDDETYENLLYLMRNYYDEIRKRGTIQVIKRRTIYDLDNSDSDSASFGRNIAELDGELLRAICFNKCDEFIFNFRKNEKLGWNLKNSSPLYKGTSNMEGCNKIWSRLLTSTDYLKYPLFGSEKIISISDGDESDSDSNSDALINKNFVINISGLVPTDASGFGIDNANPLPSAASILQYAINVDSNIDYAFEFRVKTAIALGAAQNPLPFLSVGINAFDCNGVVVNLSNIINLTTTVYFLQNGALNKSNKYYIFRGIIYSKNKYPSFNSSNIYKIRDVVRVVNTFYTCVKKTTVGILISNTTYWRLLSQRELYSLLTCNNWYLTNNLQFTEGVKKIIPFIKVTDSASVTDSVFLAEIRLQPVATNYSSGFLDTSNWIDFFIKNNNQNYKYRQLKEIFRHKLLPADTEVEFNQLEKTIAE